MVNPLVAFVFGILGGFIGATLYDGLRYDVHQLEDGSFVRVVDTNAEFIDEYQ